MFETTPVASDPASWPKLLRLAIHEASDDFAEVRKSSSTSWGMRMALRSGKCTGLSTTDGVFGVSLRSGRSQATYQVVVFKSQGPRGPCLWTRLVRWLRNYRDTRTPSGVLLQVLMSKEDTLKSN